MIDIKKKLSKELVPGEIGIARAVPGVYNEDQPEKRQKVIFVKLDPEDSKKIYVTTPRGNRWWMWKDDFIRI